MAIAPPTPCTAGNCHRLATQGNRCAAHQRPSAQARGYTSAWAVYARDWLRRYPWCGMRHDGLFHGEHSQCARGGRRVRARVVDHIKPLSSGGALLDPANHQSLCASCNTRKG
jgi:5-methylcytosine-specific restriction endonuclease McrA